MIGRHLDPYRLSPIRLGNLLLLILTRPVTSRILILVQTPQHIAAAAKRRVGPIQNVFRRGPCAKWSEDNSSAKGATVITRIMMISKEAKRALLIASVIRIGFILRISFQTWLLKNSTVP